VGVGKRRYYVTIQSATRTSDGQGGYTLAWADSYSEWAAMKYLSGSRVLDSGGLRYRKAVEFLIRANDTYTLSPEHRISFGGEYFTINSVLPSEKMNDLTVLAYV